MEHYLNIMFVADMSINIVTLKVDLKLVVRTTIFYNFSILVY